MNSENNTNAGTGQNAGANQNTQPVVAQPITQPAGPVPVLKQKAPKPPKAPTAKSGGSKAAIVFSVFALLIGLGGAGLGAWAMIELKKPKVTPNYSNSTDERGYYTGNTAEFENTSVSNIVSKVTPAVVSIVVETKTTSAYDLMWGYNFGNGSGSTSTSAGTGMIVTSDGYVITNKHVAENATSIQIITDSGETYNDVKVVGLDPLNDVAYLKISGVSDLPTVTLGDSKTLSIGQPVLAIGNALGTFQNSVTQGIVSGLGRSITAYESDGSGGENLSDLIQTDAAINPGNSGGPLVNAAGDVIGINSATSTEANGLGFSIPISATKGMLKGIIEDNKAARAYVGVSYITVTPDIAKEYKLPVNYGAYLYSESSRSSVVAKDGPAEKAGIKKGDIITKVAGVQIGSAGTLSSLVAEYKVGETIELEYIRDGETRTTQVTLGAYKAN